MTDQNTPGDDRHPTSPVLPDPANEAGEHGASEHEAAEHEVAEHGAGEPETAEPETAEPRADHDEAAESPAGADAAASEPTIGQDAGTPAAEAPSVTETPVPATAAETAGAPAPARAWSVGPTSSAPEAPSREPEAREAEAHGEAPVQTAESASAEPARADSPESSAPAAERPLPPLSPPSSAPAVSPSTGALHDDSALRAAEAARAGGAPESFVSSETAPTASRAETTSGAEAAVLPGAAAGAGSETGDLDDTRITTPGAGRSSSAWTPPPAPASPADYAPPAASTPTPYAPPEAQATGALPVAQTAAFPTPAERLGFGDGIAGGDDGFTPEELAQRRAFRDEMSFRQKQEFAGINFGAAFFGWLASVGLAGLLYIIAGGIAVATGVASKDVVTGTKSSITTLGSDFSTQSLQITALVVVLVILFVSYFVGGYVAGRMARFSGLKQGLAVWLWGLVLSVIAGVVGVVLASQSTTIKSMQGTPMSVSDFTSVSFLVGAGLVVVLSLGGALLGGLAGMRFHRRVDRFGFEEV